MALLILFLILGGVMAVAWWLQEFSDDFFVE